MTGSQETVARLIEGLERGDRESVDGLFDLVYGELKALAHRQRRRWRDNLTMNTTALVHEAYVKLVGQARIGAGDRAHFRALAARAMRHVLCSYARERGALKRGGGHERLPIESMDAGPGQLQTASDPGRSEEALRALDAALLELEKTRPRACRVVECRFFGGMGVEETAAAVGTSTRSVKRDWAMAQAWLYRELETERPAIERRGEPLPDE